MTNADKYNLTREQVKQLVMEFVNFCTKNEEELYNEQYNEGGKLEAFLKAPIQPTLTEDERVILKQVSKAYVKFGKNGFGQFIFRIDNGEPFLLNNTAEKIFDGLFQFIKERRRI